MDTTYQPKEIEAKWAQIWEKNGYFEPSGQGKPYCIMIPPPNVTGHLHMGHAFQSTLMDIVIRYQRMSGHNTLWQMGTDHAGIATQMVVERQLNHTGKTRHDIGRDAFIKKTWGWKNESGGMICKQIRRLAASVAWSKEAFTLDDKRSDAVREAFVRLYRDGLIYKGKRLVNWDPKLQTAISDLEIVHREVQGNLWTIRYFLDQSTQGLDVATTRPETLFGDQAVAVHPEDKRYQHMIGQKVRIPLSNRLIPIIADDSVDQSFGTGCVKVTPAHDFNDNMMGKRHGLTYYNILTADGHLNAQVPKPFQGLERFAARKAVLKALETSKQLIQTVPHTHKVPYGDRSEVVVEPWLTDQWFMKMQHMADEALKCVNQGAITLVPSNWTNTYRHWLTDIQDWCISRQLWWGHRIPAWYDATGKCYVGHNEAAVRDHYQLAPHMTLTQDEDVLDTWFSSALWPFSTLGWPEKTEDIETFFPTQLLVTGFDIIFFWVARMIMLSLKLTGQVPFKKVYITGLIRDQFGQKMSKSKGNVIDPLDIIDGISLPALIKKRSQNLMQPKMAETIIKKTKKAFPEGIQGHGVDALRFTLAALASHGRDINFDFNRLTGYRNFCNKLWNAARYVSMQAITPDMLDAHINPTQIMNRWMRARTQETVNQVHHHIAQLRFDLLANTLYEFIWHDFCDWYLELTKPALQGQDNTAKKETLIILIQTLQTILTLAHPLIPYITEAIWHDLQTQFKQPDNSLMLQSFPAQKATTPDHEAAAAIQWLQAIVTGIRTLRSEINLSPAKVIEIQCQHGNTLDQSRMATWFPLLKPLIKMDAYHWLAADATPPISASIKIDTLQLHLPMKGLVDSAHEIARLKKHALKIEKQMDQLKQRLNNPKFVDHAPEHVVNQVKQQHDAQQAQLALIQSQLQQWKAL